MHSMHSAARARRTSPTGPRQSYSEAWKNLCFCLHSGGVRAKTIKLPARRTAALVGGASWRRLVRLHRKLQHYWPARDRWSGQDPHLGYLRSLGGPPSPGIWIRARCGSSLRSPRSPSSPSSPSYAHRRHRRRCSRAAAARRFVRSTQNYWRPGPGVRMALDGAPNPSGLGKTNFW